MSLRMRLLVGMAAVVAMLVVVGVVVTHSTEDKLVRQVDDQLERAAPRIGPGDGEPTTPSRRPGRGTGDGTGGPGIGGLLGSTPPGTMYLAVLRADATALRTLAEPNLTEAAPSAPAVTPAEVRRRADDGPFTVAATGSSLRYRVLVRPVGSRGALMLYGIPLEDVDAAVDQLVIVEILASLAIVAVLGLVTFWVLHLGVRPLKVMTETATAIGEGDLSQRIPPSAPRTEAGALGTALNKMLGRIEGAFDERTRSEARLRQFVADASHELRTPVTTIRGYAELYRRGGLPDDDAVAEAMRRTEEEAIRMGSLVEDLLHLARLDEGRPLRLGPVDLAAVVADAAGDAHAVDPDRPVTVRHDDDPGHPDRPVAPVTVIGDDGQIRQVVANLVANARVHTPPGTAITLAVHRDGDDVVVDVHDDGPGMTPDHAERAFERFYRADAARSRHTGGSGLGLAIVAGVMAAHGGTATLDTAPDRGTTVRLRLPVAGPTTPRPAFTTPDAAPTPGDHPIPGELA